MKTISINRLVPLIWTVMTANVLFLAVSWGLGVHRIWFLERPVVLLPCITLATCFIYASAWRLLRDREIRLTPIQGGSYRPKRIIVFMPKRIGDLVMANFVPNALREVFGSKEPGIVPTIDVVVMSDGKPLLHRGDGQGAGFDHIVDHFRDEDNLMDIRETQLDRFIESVRLCWILRGHRYDLSVHLTHTPRMGFVALLAGIPRRYGLRFRGWRNAITTHNFILTDWCPAQNTVNSHEVYIPRREHYANLMYRMGYVGYDITRKYRIDRTNPSIEVTPDAIRAAMKVLRMKGINYKHPLYNIFAPGASGRREQKRWDIQNYIDLANCFYAHGQVRMPLVFTFGPGEHHLRDQVRMALSPLHERGVYLVDHRDGDLAMMAALHKQAVITVCNDSGPLHLSRVTGGRAIAVWGPTSPLYHKYDAIGDFWLVRPEDGSCDIGKVTVANVYREAKLRIDQTLLRMKVDRLLKELCDEEMPRPAGIEKLKELPSKVRECWDKLEAGEEAIAESIDQIPETDRSAKAAELERLAIIQLLLEKKDESRRSYMRLREYQSRTPFVLDNWDAIWGQETGNAAEIKEAVLI